jgi:signal transduction histidine kinase/DNA-binding response OmpR family regulator/HAMP domain-containing protein
MKWLKNLKVQVKLFIAFGIFILLMFLFVLFTAQQLSYADSNYNSAIRRQIRISESLGIMAQLRLNNATMSYTLYDDNLASATAGFQDIDYESLCDSFVQNIQNNLDSVLQDTALSDEEKRFRLNAYYRIDYLFQEHYKQFFHTISEGVHTRDVAMISQGMANAYAVGTEITAILNELYNTASNVTSAMSNQLSASSQRMIYSLFAAAAAIMIISILVSLFMGKIITSPIAEIEKAMAEISSGNLNYPIRSAYKDELGALSNRIGDMVDDILEMNKAVAAIDYLDTMIYATDLEYNLIYINRRLANMFRIDRDTFKMKKCYKALRGRDYPCEICQLPTILQNKEAFPSVEYHDIWDEELGIWIGGRASIIRWTDGNIVHYQTINDESQKKKYEGDLQKAVQNAEAASISKTTFLANMSHEIRTPMNSIIGFSELALDGNIPEKTRDYLRKIMLNSEWMLQIINDILDISKIEAGKMEIEKIPFDLHELFVACRTIITPKADEKGVDLYFYAEPSIGKKLIGDPVRLRQVLLNILSNAVKFTNTGGMIKILAIAKGASNGAPNSKSNNAANSTITIDFEIKDSGIGMSPDQMDRIYEPFMQAEAGTTRKYGGSGLGLPISKNIIEMMGGKLSIESALGVGSKFSFELTFDTIDAPESDFYDDRMIGNKIEKPYFNGTVLVCEDNLMNQQMLCDHLERVGLQIEVAEDGLIGVEKVHKRVDKGEKPYDLIFMDIHMPVMDGIEAASKIAKLGTGTPIVALTANIMANDRELYLKNGMKDCVGKPFVSQELWRCLLKYLKPVEWKAESPAQNRQADQRLLGTLTLNFLNDHPETFHKITDAIESGDIKLAHRLAHTLKSNAGLIGMTVLQKAALEVESLLRGGKNQVTPDAMNALETELNAVLGELKPLAKTASSSKQTLPEPASLSTDETREFLAGLKPLLERGNPECLKLTHSLRGIRGSSESLVQTLIQQMEDLDFEQATQTLAELMNNSL